MPPLNKSHNDEHANFFWHYWIPPSEDDENDESFSPHGGTVVESSSTFQVDSKVSAVSLAPSQQRRVRFAEEDEFYGTIMREDYTDKELVDSWYRAADFYSFREDISTSILLMKEDPARLDDVYYTSRGIESRVGDFAKQRSIVRSTARAVVLGAHPLQVGGIFERDKNMVALLYQHESSVSVREALNLASLDQESARQYQKEVYSANFFNDDWISSLSTEVSTFASMSNTRHKTQEEATLLLDMTSGFDESWLFDNTIAA